MNLNIERMNAEIRRYIPLIIQKEVADPKIGMVSVNEVKPSKDGTYVTVYVSFLGSTEPQKNLNALKKAAGFIRKSLSQKMKVRFIPEIRFVYDDLYDKLDSLSAAINS